MPNLDAQFTAEAHRRDDPAIVAARRQDCLYLGGRVHYQSGGYVAGTVLAQNSVNSEFYAYNDAGSSGLNTAKCILTRPIKETDFESSTGNVLQPLLFKGTVYKDRLTGLDANGTTDLGGRTLVGADGVNLLVF